MSFARKLGMVLTVLLGLTAAAWAQRGGMGPRPPQMPMNWFKPTAGSGAQYDGTVEGKPMNVAFVALGKENVEGKDAYWIEIRMEGGGLPGESVVKQLVVVAEGNSEVKRMIMQGPGMPPMEMPAAMLSMAKQQTPAQSEGPGEKVGTESVTVPAGTFDCDHYRKDVGMGKVIDYWVSTKVPPYGLVKMTSPDASMNLKKTLSNETSHIKGEPSAMPSFPR